MRQKTGIKHPILLSIAIVIVAAIVVARLYLAEWVKDYVNDQIAQLKGYSGSVGDIDIDLWRGAYVIHKLDINKTQTGVKRPFVAAETVDMAVQWDALLHGKVVAQVEMDNIALTFAKSQNGKGADWVTFVNNLTPFDINDLSINGGKISYVDYSAKGSVDLYIEDIHAKVTNLRNVDTAQEALPSDLHIKGLSIGKGALRVDGRINILREVPDFNLKLKLEDAALPAFNEFTRNAAALDFNSGSLSIYSELAAVNGHITGYVKPIATNVKMVTIDKAKNPINFIWETLAAGFIEIFKNHPTDQFALRIPIDGTINNPHEDMWTGFWSIFQNAFGQAFVRNTDGSINFDRTMKMYHDDGKQ